MRDVVRLQSTVRRGYYRIVSNKYSYMYKDETKFQFVFDEILGAVVHAGYKTRQYHLKGPHPCVGLKKLYLFWDNKTSDYRLTTNFLDVNNKGDRQPIGMCGAYKGHCGADLPLAEYKQDKSRAAYYGVSEKNVLSLSLSVVKNVCYIFSRSEEQVKRESKLDADINFDWGNLADKLVQIYAIYSNQTTRYYTHEKAIVEAKNKDVNYIFAFNLIKPEFHEEVAKICELRPIAQYINDKGLIVTFDDPERDSKLREEGFKPYPNTNSYILGYGIQKEHYCGSRIRYVINQVPQTGDVRALPVGHLGAYTKSFHNGFFYSL